MHTYGHANSSPGLMYQCSFSSCSANKEFLGITSYGVSATSIQDVFFSVMKDAEVAHFDRR